MQKSKVTLLIISAVIIASGCSVLNGTDDGSANSGDAIAVERFEVVPQEIYAGSELTANLNIRNVGNTEADIQVGEDGKNVLKSYTPDLLRITSFSAESTAETDTKTDYTLQPDETLSMNWDLHQYDESRIRFYSDQQIDMTFQVPFQYTVEAYRQFQIKESNDVDSLDSLGAGSSNGPLDIHIELIGSSAEEGAPVLISDDNVQIRVEFTNSDAEEGDGVGLVEIESPEIEALSEDLDVENCDTPENIRVQADSSTVITCDLNFDSDDVGTSIQDEIQVSSDYNFTKTISKEHITVQYRG